MKQGWAVWITGLPASGKTYITRELVRRLEQRGVFAQVLESDPLRKVLTPQPTYSPEEREVFYSSMVYIGSLLTGNGVNVIFDAVANRRRWRDRARSETSRFVEVYVDTPFEVCHQRDPKGIYRLADRGQATYVPWLQQVYEAPVHPEAVVDGTRPPGENVDKIMEVFEANGFF